MWTLWCVAFCSFFYPYINRQIYKYIGICAYMFLMGFFMCCPFTIRCKHPKQHDLQHVEKRGCWTHQGPATCLSPWWCHLTFLQRNGGASLSRNLITGGEELEMVLRAILKNHLYVCLQPNLVFLFFPLKNPLPLKLQHFLLLETQFPYPLSLMKVWLSFQH